MDPKAKKSIFPFLPACGFLAITCSSELCFLIQNKCRKADFELDTLVLVLVGNFSRVVPIFVVKVRSSIFHSRDQFCCVR